MKLTISLFLIFSVLFHSQETKAQSAQNKKVQNMFKDVMKKKGYRIVDEGGIANRTKTNVLNTDRRTYYKGASYVFYGLVENCSSCSVSIKFAQPGQIPANLPDEKVEIVRGPETKLTVISTKTGFKSTGEGYFILFNNSNTKRYVYGMLFEKK